MKRRHIGRPTHTVSALFVRGGWRKPGIYGNQADSGRYKYYAGPVILQSQSRCVRYAATASMPKEKLFKSWVSRWGHCD